MTDFSITKMNINKYLRDIELAKSLSEKTMKAYKEDLYGFLDWIETNGITLIDQTHINYYFIYLTEERNNKSTTLQRNPAYAEQFRVCPQKSKHPARI